MSVKLRTVKRNRFNSTMSTDVGNVVVDAEGFCEVESEDAAILLTKVGFEIIDAELDAKLKQEKLDAAKAEAADKKAARDAEDAAEAANLAKLEKEAADAEANKKPAPIKGAETPKVVNTTDEANGGTPEIIEKAGQGEIIEGDDAGAAEAGDGKVDLNLKSFSQLKNVCIAMEYDEAEWKSHKSKASLVKYLEEKLEA